MENVSKRPLIGYLFVVLHASTGADFWHSSHVRTNSRTYVVTLATKKSRLRIAWCLCDPNGKPSHARPSESPGAVQWGVQHVIPLKSSCTENLTTLQKPFLADDSYSIHGFHRMSSGKTLRVPAHPHTCFLLPSHLQIVKTLSSFNNL